MRVCVCVCVVCVCVGVCVSVCLKLMRSSVCYFTNPFGHVPVFIKIKT